MSPVDTHQPEALPRLYAVWRRRMLAGALAATAVGLATHGATWEIHYEFGEKRPSLWVTLGLVMLLVCTLGPGMVATGFALCALGSWRRLRRSSRLARWAWILWVLGPLPVLLLPISHILGLEGEDALKTSTNQAAYILTVTAPALFALLPGVLRASLVIERFIPESRTPGQITLLAAPACIMAYLLPLGVLAQFAFQPELYLGLLLLASSPVIPLLAARRLHRSNTPKQASRLVRTIAVFQGGLAALGAALLIGWVGEHPVLRAWIGQVDPIWVLSVVARTLASKWLTTVVVADLLVLMLHQGREAARALANTAEGEVLGRKLDSLGHSLRSAEPLTRSDS